MIKSQLTTTSTALLLLLIVFQLTIPYLLAGDTPETADEMTKELILTENKAPVQWNNIIPGKTTAGWIRTNIDEITSERNDDEKTIFLLPPGLADENTEIDILFGRVATVTCNNKEIVESINIGSFFPHNRPNFEEIKNNLGLEFALISETSSYSATSSVYSAIDAHVWLIVSNIKTNEGKRQVLALRYYSKGIKDNLPLPLTPYKR